MNKKLKLSIQNANKNIIKEFEKAINKRFKSDEQLDSLKQKIQNNTSTYDDSDYVLMMEYTDVVNELAEEENAYKKEFTKRTKRNKKSKKQRKIQNKSKKNL